MIDYPDASVVDRSAIGTVQDDLALLEQHAELYASLMTTPPVLDAIAKRMGVPGGPDLGHRRHHRRRPRSSSPWLEARSMPASWSPPRRRTGSSSRPHPPSRFSPSTQKRHRSPARCVWPTPPPWASATTCDRLPSNKASPCGSFRSSARWAAREGGVTNSRAKLEIAGTDVHHRIRAQLRRPASAPAPALARLRGSPPGRPAAITPHRTRRWPTGRAPRAYSRGRSPG